MSVLSRWRKGWPANADLAMPAAGPAPLPALPAARPWRRLPPRRGGGGAARGGLKPGAAVVVVVVVAVVAADTAMITYVFLPLPVDLPEERLQPEAMASTVFALDGTPIGQFKGAESQTAV